MYPRIAVKTRHRPGNDLVLFTDSPDSLPGGIFSDHEIGLIHDQRKKKLEMIPVNRLDHWVMIQFVADEKEPDHRMEKCRKAGDKIQQFLNEQKVISVTVSCIGTGKAEAIALLEGMALGGYQFRKYKTGGEDCNTLREIGLFPPVLSKKAVRDINAIIEGVALARDLVNEPNSYLTASVFSREVELKASEAGIKTEVLSGKKLEALKMGGLLGVNRGSHEPPAFIVLEYCNPGTGNEKPIVLIGKGIMYDTGGMNLKTESHMENMKNDMAGAAAVVGTLLALARAGIPGNVIGLVPATDNRPGPRAIVPGDVLRMHNGMTVEVISTDAEGRLVLADALSYARRYGPALVIDLATLTGSAVRAIGRRAIAGMQSGAKDAMEQLQICGSSVSERIVEFPLWDDYDEDLKSDLADTRNLGGPEAGAITAGKFLQKFTGYPFIHLDIAGPAFLDKRDTYRGKGGTGVGVRLLVEFLRRNR